MQFKGRSSKRLIYLKNFLCSKNGSKKISCFFPIHVRVERIFNLNTLKVNFLYFFCKYLLSAINWWQRMNWDEEWGWAEKKRKWGSSFNQILSPPSAWHQCNENAMQIPKTQISIYAWIQCQKFFESNKKSPYKKI